MPRRVSQLTPSPWQAVLAIRIGAATFSPKSCAGAPVVNADISPRLQARVHQDYPPQAVEKVITFLRTVPVVHAASRQDPERLQAAAFILLEGDVRRIPQVAEMLKRDWRDILVWAKLGHSNWPDRLNEMLGPLP
jgi:hypothetical protein